MAFELGYSLLMAAKITLFFILIYIFIPLKLIRFEEEANTLLDKIFISLTHSTIITIIIVHLLAFLKLYETFSLLLCYLATYLLFAWLRGRSPAAITDAMGMKLIVNLLDMSEGRLGLGSEVKISLKKWAGQLKDSTFMVVRRFFNYPFSGLLPVGVFVAAVFLRFKNSIMHAAYIHIDSYLHLFWVKCIGNNQIYHDGIYPYGYHAVISSISKLTFIDPYWLCRFLGPLGGALLVLSIYYFAAGVTRNHVASLIPLVVYGLVTHGDFPSVMFRQTGALPQEYAAIFMLPSLYFFWLYLKTQKQAFLLLCAEALAITIMVHPYASAYLIIWLGVMTISAVILKRLAFKDFFKVFVFGFVTGVVSLLPFAVGFLMGKEFFKDSASYIQQNIVTGGFGESSIKVLLGKLVTHSLFLDISLPIVFLLIISLVIIRGKEWVLISITVSGCSIIMGLLYRAPELNLPVFTDHFRTGIFLSSILAILYACGFNAIEKCIFELSGNLLQRFRELMMKGVSMTLCLAVIFYYQPVIPYRGMEEYDEAAKAYLAIRNNFPALDWTIIGPPEQFSQVVGMGWHYQILRFVQDFDLKKANDPQFKIPIPTHHIFAFTEKRPLNLGREVTDWDAEIDLEPEGDDPFMQYYHNKEQRAIIEAKAIKWVETYKNTHQGVEVFYEDENIKIYYIYHEPKIEL